MNYIDYQNTFVVEIALLRCTRIGEAAMLIAGLWLR